MVNKEKYQPLHDSIVEIGLKWVEVFENEKIHPEVRQKIIDAILLLKFSAELLITEVGGLYSASFENGEMVIKKIGNSQIETVLPEMNYPEIPDS